MPLNDLHQQVVELTEDIRSLRDHVDSEHRDLREEIRSSFDKVNASTMAIVNKLDGGSDIDRGIIPRLQSVERETEALKITHDQAIKAAATTRKRRRDLIWAVAGAALMAGATYLGDHIIKSVVPTMPAAVAK